MAILDVDHVTAVVADADAAAEVLSRLLGHEPIERVALPGMAIRTFQLGGVQLHVNAPTGPGPVAAFHQAHGAGLHHLALRVQDLDATLRGLRAAGFVTLGPPTQTAPGLREVFLDPRGTAGLIIQLVERAEAAAPAPGQAPPILDTVQIADLASQLDCSKTAGG